MIIYASWVLSVFPRNIYGGLTLLCMWISDLLSHFTYITMADNFNQSFKQASKRSINQSLCMIWEGRKQNTKLSIKWCWTSNKINLQYKCLRSDKDQRHTHQSPGHSLLLPSLADRCICSQLFDPACVKERMSLYIYIIHRCVYEWVSVGWRWRWAIFA